jgi:tripartite-type tricarboxylate transporter receptor subunit TctC
MAPAGTPTAIIDKLHRKTVQVLNEADVCKRFEDQGVEIVANAPGEFAALIASETPRWAKVIKDAGIKGSE